MNPHLGTLPSDFLYHIGYNKEDAKKLFGDVKFVVMGGSSKRMATFAEKIAKAINHPQTELKHLDMTRTDRFCLYKIGPVISVNHGMGVPSVSILLHEILKLLHYAEAVDPIIIRMGTCGGLGLPAGTVVITDKTVNGYVEEQHEMIILGKRVQRPAVMSKPLADEILKAQTDTTFKTTLGTTMCTDDFYEGQGRIDGACCDYTKEEQIAYLKEIHEKGVKNIEMEATALASLCNKAGFKCAIVCVTLLNRLEGDQVDIPPDVYASYQERPQNLVCDYIRGKLAGNY